LFIKHIDNYREISYYIISLLSLLIKNYKERSNMKRLIAIILAISMLLLCACATKPANPKPAPDASGKEVVSEQPNDSVEADVKTYKIGVIPMSMDDSFQVGMTESARAYGEAQGYEMVIQGGLTLIDSEQQLKLIETMIANGCDAILCAPNDPAAMANGVKMCQHAGVVFVNYDMHINEEAYAAAGVTEPAPFVGTSAVEIGTMAGEIVLENNLANKGDKVVLVRGAESHANSIVRHKAFLEAVGEDYFEIVMDQATDWTADEGFEVVQTALTAHPDVKLIYTVACNLGIGAASAVDAAGLTGQINIVAVDIIPENAELIKDGTIAVGVAQQCSIGEEAVKVAVQALNGKPYEAVTYVPPVSSIGLDVDAFIAKNFPTN